MLNLLFKKNDKRSKPTQKILLTLFILFLFRLGNTIPLSGIDQEALKKSFAQLENKNSIMQLINMYSGSGANLLTPFSLGIIPYINSSIIVDLLTALFPFLEKLQSEEGELGRKKLNFYKKILTLLFGIVQTFFLLVYLKSYIYDTDLLNLCVLGLELVTGAMIIVWLTGIIDNKGIGNGTSLIILTNIVVTLLGKQDINKNILSTVTISNFLEIFFLLLLMLFICISQSARINIEVVSARQLAFLENLETTTINKSNSSSYELKDNGLAIRLNQAGIFPIIIASNLIPVISYFSTNQYIITLFYYLLIISFNYFYTIVFWDPEKISEQLRKASVSIVNITPGQETVSYLENVVRSSSILGGIFLCLILFFYEFIKQFIKGPLLTQLNISSLIILVGVAFELQKTIRSLYKNNFDVY